MSYGAVYGATLFLDLDGVMADFDGAFPAKFGFDHRTVPDDVMWAHIDGDQNYFRDLPPCAGALEFFERLRRYQPIVLTACPAGAKFEDIARQKRGWVREHLGAGVPIVFTPGGKTKALYLHRPGDILIDDFERNCARWESAGGVAIHHTGSFADTWRTLSNNFGKLWLKSRTASATSHARSAAPATTSPATTTATATASDAATTSTESRALPAAPLHRPPNCS